LIFQRDDLVKTYFRLERVDDEGLCIEVLKPNTIESAESVQENR
jgi:hypothetical protein